MERDKRVVLITGASSGIGLAAAHTLAPSASHLYLVGRNTDRLQAAAGDFPATAIGADVSDPAKVSMIAAEVERMTGRLDVLVNCAGQLEIGRADELGLEVAERLIRVNYLGTVGVIHACLPLLRRGSAPVIVNVSSVAGRLAPPYMAAYAASKFAITGYSQALRQELRPEGIHVGLVFPGPVDTPMVRERLGGTYYPLPPGTPVLTAGRVARAIQMVVEQRLPEVTVPRRLAAATRLGSAFPALVDRFYTGIAAAGAQRD
ncbi:MAG TPA: SDR family NAD(P)-dependent oxidoreductase [Symbiobacteriaceae bacterium]|nr:SDR family NAD(P)-dependent oxidoreductase [Symbiobacteriaceae bacterium]